jgi:hypothetical protein
LENSKPAGAGVIQHAVREGFGQGRVVAAADGVDFQKYWTPAFQKYEPQGPRLRDRFYLL